MGVVYLARDPALDRLVALKVLRTDVAREPDALSRFRAEAKTLAALSHPGIVTVYEIGRDDSQQQFIAMEFLAGRSLRQLLTGPDRPGRAELLVIATRAALALAAAHRAGVLHRDVKPDNVMIGDRGQVKVVDFGVARRLDEPAGRTAAGGEDSVVGAMLADTIEVQPAGAGDHRTHTIFGTPAYMAPEVLMGRPSTPPSDAYGFGVLLYEVFTGRLPHDAATVHDLLQKVIDPDLPPRPAGEVAEDLPDALADLIDVMLAFEPAARPSMDEVAHRLAAIAAGLQRGDATPRRRRMPVALAAAAALALAGGGSLGVAAWRDDGDAARPLVAAPRSIRVAVGPFTHAVGGTGAPDRAIAIRTMFAHTLGAIDAFDVLDGGGSWDAAGEGAFLAAAAGRGAAFAVTGRFEEGESGTRGEVRLFDLGDRRRPAFAAVTRGRPGELVPVIAQLSGKVADHLVPAVEVPHQPLSSIHAVEYYEAGMRALMANEWDTATLYLEAAVTRQEDYFDAWYQLAWARAWAANLPPRRTRDALARAEALAPSERERVALHALEHYLDLEYAAVQGLLEPMGDELDRDRDLTYLLAEAYYHDGHIARALPLFERALQLSPGFTVAATHPFYQAIAAGNLDKAEWIRGMFPAVNHEDLRRDRIRFARGEYQAIADGGDSGGLHPEYLGALALLGRDADLARALGGPLRQSDPRIAIEVTARALAAGDRAAAEAALEPVWRYLADDTRSGQHRFTIGALAEVVVMAEDAAAARRLLGYWDRPREPTEAGWMLRMHAAPLLGRRDLLHGAPTWRAGRTAEAITAEMDGDHARALAVWRELLAEPYETGDYLPRFALARNLQALGRRSELAAVCRDMTRPAVYRTSLVNFLAACRRWNALPR